MTWSLPPISRTKIWSARGLAQDLGLEHQVADQRNCFGSTVGLIVEIARFLTLRLINELAAMDVDASQADISRVSLDDLDVLAGVVWTNLTVWPPTVKEQIKSRSQQVGPGMFRVQRLAVAIDRDLTNV